VRLKELGLDLRKELAPHFASAKRMLGVSTNPFRGAQDEFLRKTAERMGVAHTFGPVPSAVYFGDPGVTSPDPYFGGEGPGTRSLQPLRRLSDGLPQRSKNSPLSKLPLFRRKEGRGHPA
jgi:cholesterol oxidase